MGENYVRGNVRENVQGVFLEGIFRGNFSHGKYPGGIVRTECPDY